MRGSRSRQQEKANEWRKNVAEATKAFGECSVRPQDEEAKFRRLQMIKNLNAVEPSTFEPSGFRDSVLQFIDSAPCPDSKIVDINELMRRRDCVGLVEDVNTLQACIQSLETHSVLAVDFEFHLKYSYDGYIAVAQAASLEKTYVFDAIRLAVYMRKGFIDIMQNPNIIKVFCGMDNDVLRMKKDWNCYMVGIFG